MATRRSGNRTVDLDEEDRKILRLLQNDATDPLDKIAARIGMSKTAVWNRIQRLQESGVIERQAAILNPHKAGLPETFFVSIRAAEHSDDWLAQLQAVVRSMPEITEAHRLAGHIDYLLKVQVATTQDFDLFYKTLVNRIRVFDVTSSLSMETLKRQTALPI
ncbi:MAG: Lrp/AsnC family transcriptional regulator [Hyphomicrobiales bacterium]|nr:Lrp/AsnC family transcriptional regulator [Hyphomicrobiales bacterium]